MTARDKKTQSLLKKARLAGRPDEDGLARNRCHTSEADPSAEDVQQWHELQHEDQAEDYKLHLKDVTDYQRMSASVTGIEAAAKVLEKHAINCTVRQTHNRQPASRDRF